jgi:hypothetical protein
LFLAVKTKGLEAVDHSYIYTNPKMPMRPGMLYPLTLSILEVKVRDMKSKAEYLKKIVFDYFVLFMIEKIFTLQMTKEGGKTSRETQHLYRESELNNVISFKGW